MRGRVTKQPAVAANRLVVRATLVGQLVVDHDQVQTSQVEAGAADQSGLPAVLVA